MTPLQPRSLFALSAALWAFAASAASTVSVSQVEMPTYPFSDPDPVPCTAERRYPYFRYDGSTANAVTQKWTAVVLENDKVRVTMLPEIGGKVWGAEDKATGREFIYYNHSVKFRNIAMRGPWCSGGIEFNFGIMGHSPTTATPVDWTTRRNPDGSASCFVSATEYVNRTTWQVEVNLPADADFFTTKTTWFNGSNLPQPYYQWMTAAYSARQNPELVFPGSAYIGHDGDAHAWPVDEKGRDLHVYGNNAFGGSKSYHVLNGNHSYFSIWWPEAGFGSYHRSDVKYGRKIWLWALSREGGIWEDLLTDVDGQYVELQSGRVFNQPRGDTYRTPFKHPTFAPGAVDVFEEKWGVMRAKSDADAECAPPLQVERPLVAPKEFDWNSAYGLYVRGEQALRERDDRTAADYLARSVAREPCFAPALRCLAELAIRHGDAARARELCAVALSVDTYDPAANYLDGFAAAMQDSRHVARERLTLAAFSPLYRAPAEALMAKLALRDGDWARADAHALRATQAGSFNFDAWQVRIVCARKTGDREGVRKMVRLADRVAPLFHGIRFEAKLLGEMEEKELWSLVRGELPEQTRLELGTWYETAGLYDEAVELFSRSRDFMAKVRLAHLHHRRGDDAVAAKILKSVAEMPAAGVSPFRWESRPALAWAASTGASWKFKYLHAVLLASFGEDAEADRLLDECDTADEAAFFLYRASRRKGDARMKDLLSARSCGDSWRVGRDLMKCQIASGDFDGACRTGRSYLDRFVGCNPIEILHARALCGAGRYEEAVSFLGGLNVLPSEHGENAHGAWQSAWDGIAREALKAGDAKKADEALRRRAEYPENLGLGKPFPRED